MARSSNQLYPVDGGSIDWAYGELGMAAFSTELGGDDFLVSYSCIDNPGCGSSQGLWPENRGMLLYLAKIARTPYLTSHGPDANTVVTSPPSVPQGVPSQLTASINFAWSNNTFSQNVGAAEYYIDTPPWAGGTAIPMNGSFNSPTVAVDATINTASLSVGRHVIFVQRTRRERLPGLPDLGADQCGVPGCDWRWNTNTNPKRHSYSNGDADCHSATHSDAEVQPVAKSSSNARSPPLT